MAVDEASDPREDVSETSTGSMTDPVVLAARQFVVEMFEIVAAELPALLKVQTPPSPQAPQFTVEMVDQLKAQVSRAIGLPPTPKDPPK